MQTGCFHKAVGPKLRAIRCQSDLANQLYYMYISGLPLPDIVSIFQASSPREIIL